jgi:hypothetical protein
MLHAKKTIKITTDTGMIGRFLLIRRFMLSIWHAPDAAAR